MHRISHPDHGVHSRCRFRSTNSPGPHPPGVHRPPPCAPDVSAVFTTACIRAAASARTHQARTRPACTAVRAPPPAPAPPPSGETPSRGSARARLRRWTSSPHGLSLMMWSLHAALRALVAARARVCWTRRLVACASRSWQSRRPVLARPRTKRASRTLAGISTDLRGEGCGTCGSGHRGRIRTKRMHWACAITRRLTTCDCPGPSR